MNTPTVPVSAERLAELIGILQDPRFDLGPLDVRDMVDALNELATVRGTNVTAWNVTPVNSAIATGLRETADAAGPGPLAERLRQSAAALDALCGSIVAVLQLGTVAHGPEGDLLRASLVTAGAR